MSFEFRIASPTLPGTSSKLRELYRLNPRRERLLAPEEDVRYGTAEMIIPVEQSDCTALLTLGAAPLSSVPRHLSWSQDGQLLLVTELDINILVGLR